MNTKNKPIGRTVGRQLVAELPAESAPVEVIIDADNRLRRVEPGVKANKVTTLSLWAAAARNIEVSLLDASKDIEFMQGATIGFQVLGLRMGADPMTPRAPRPLNAESLGGAVGAVLDNAGLIADELPTALHNIDLGSMRKDASRLAYIGKFRGELRLLDQAMEAVQTQVENRLAPLVDSIHERGKSVINSHLVLRDRLQPLLTFCVGPAEDAADSRKENNEHFQRGVEFGRAQFAKEQQEKAAAAKSEASEAENPEPPTNSRRKRS